MGRISSILEDDSVSFDAGSCSYRMRTLETDPKSRNLYGVV